MCVVRQMCLSISQKARQVNAQRYESVAAVKSVKHQCPCHTSEAKAKQTFMSMLCAYGWPSPLATGKTHCAFTHGNVRLSLVEVASWGASSCTQKSNWDPQLDERSIFRLVQAPQLSRRAGGCVLRLSLPISVLVVAGCAAARVKTMRFRCKYFGPAACTGFLGASVFTCARSFSQLSTRGRSALHTKLQEVSWLHHVCQIAALYAGALTTRDRSSPLVIWLMV